MMKIHLHPAYYDVDWNAVKEFCSYVAPDIEFVLMREMETVKLPNFNDYLTKGVYTGTIHSFMPPRAHTYRNILTLEIETPAHLQRYLLREVLFRYDDFRYESMNYHLRGSYNQGYVASIVTAELKIYLPPENLTKRSLINISNSICRAQSEIQSGYGSFGSFGYILGAILTAQSHFTFFFDGHDLFPIGFTPRPDHP